MDFQSQVSVTVLAKDAPADSWVRVAEGSEDDLRTQSLVLSSMGISHRCIAVPGYLQVQASDESRARAHLALYDRENANWPEPRAEKGYSMHMDPVTLPAMLLLFAFFLRTGEWTPNNTWFTQGAVNRTAILEHGEWWRLLTALTLHADSVHLIGNILIGGYLMHELCRILGSGTTWTLALLTGCLANWINLVFRHQQHLSVGFSAVVFSCIGLLVGLQLFRRGSMINKLLVPLGAGFCLLALLGSGGERTDLGAHLFGLCAGIPAGAAARWAQLEQQGGNARLQAMALLPAAGTVLGCWLWAFS